MKSSALICFYSDEIALQKFIAVCSPQYESIDDRVTKWLDEIKRERWPTICGWVKHAEGWIEPARQNCCCQLTDEQTVPERERGVDGVFRRAAAPKLCFQFRSTKEGEATKVLRSARAFIPSQRIDAHCVLHSLEQSPHSADRHGEMNVIMRALMLRHDAEHRFDLLHDDALGEHERTRCCRGSVTFAFEFILQLTAVGLNLRGRGKDPAHPPASCREDARDATIGESKLRTGRDFNSSKQYEAADQTDLKVR